MKKIFSLIAVLVLLSSCDDGDMTFKTFDFSTATARRCTDVEDGELFYKINGTEALIIQLADGQLINSPNIISGVNTAREITISGNNKITYVNYPTGTAPTESTMCTRIDNGTAGSDEQWIGTGVITVLTTATVVEGKITGYIHVVTLKNITFTKGSESITINNNNFGTITIPNPFTFNFSSDSSDPDATPVIEGCTNNDYLFTIASANLLLLDLSDLDAALEPGVIERPLVLTGNNPDRLYFTVYDGTVLTSRICDGGAVTSPNPISNLRWSVIAPSGSATPSIKIVTEVEVGSTYKSTVYLKNIVFANINKPTETFNLNDVAASTITTDGYLFGAYLHN